MDEKNKLDYFYNILAKKKVELDQKKQEIFLLKDKIKNEYKIDLSDNINDILIKLQTEINDLKEKISTWK